MFPKPQEVEGSSYPIQSASRDPHAEGQRLAKAMFRGTFFFGVMAVAAVLDLSKPGLGSSAYYLVVAGFTVIPLSVTVF